MVLQPVASKAAIRVAIGAVVREDDFMLSPLAVIETSKAVEW
jgi:hypothetical protein